MNYIVKKLINFSGHETLLTPFDIEFSQRVISITGEIDDDTSGIVCSAIRSLARESDEDIILYINSPGGSVTAGMSIYDTAKAVRAEICTVGSGAACSMGAFLLACAGTKGKRYIQPNAEVLIHQPIGGTSGQATDIKIHAQHILSVREKLNRILSEATGQPYEIIEADTERDKIFNSKEAAEYGLVDHIGEPLSW